jgi:hypothetical protein
LFTCFDDVVQVDEGLGTRLRPPVEGANRRRANRLMCRIQWLSLSWSWLSPGLDKHRGRFLRPSFGGHISRPTKLNTYIPDVHPEVL